MSSELRAPSDAERRKARRDIAESDKIQLSLMLW